MLIEVGIFFVKIIQLLFEEFEIGWLQFEVDIGCIIRFYFILGNKSIVSLLLEYFNMEVYNVNLIFSGLEGKYNREVEGRGE